MGSSDDTSSVRKRVFIVLLLAVSCAISIYLLWVVEPVTVYNLQSPQQLDSLITESFREFNVSNAQIRTHSIRIDSSFTRREYLVEVSPTFSKTSFHYQLHKRLWPYNAKTIGHVEFPEKNMQVHVAYNETIQRTIYLYSESED